MDERNSGPSCKWWMCLFHRLWRKMSTQWKNVFQEWTSEGISERICEQIVPVAVPRCRNKLCVVVVSSWSVSFIMTLCRTQAGYPVQGASHLITSFLIPLSPFRVLPPFLTLLGGAPPFLLFLGGAPLSSSFLGASLPSSLPFWVPHLPLSLWCRRREAQGGLGW